MSQGAENIGAAMHESPLPRPAGEGPLLDVKSLSVEVSIGGVGYNAIESASLQVSAAETLSLVGESGSGKSLMARSILGVLPRNVRVASGEIVFKGRDLTVLRERDMTRVRGNEIGLIFQDPMRALNPSMRIGEQIAEGIRLHNDVGRSQALREARELLDAVRIPSAGERLRDYPHQLSGGMCQRVMIAMALACRPDLLIADEPTTALDVTTQADILDLVKDLQQDFGMAIILVTHDMGIAGTYADSIAVMYGGRIMERAATREILERPKVPYTKGLMQSIIGPETPPHSRLPTIPGQPPSLAKMPSGCRFHPRCPNADASCGRDAPGLVSDEGPSNRDHLYACWHPEHSADESR
ncbi:MAG TPA: ABC transporter ATP-binding protein [Gammaproteobacteria bacterium]|nr:ABC transporter ATP-binding protein [Gammaproteobacteria bacterium]